MIEWDPEPKPVESQQPAEPDYYPVEGEVEVTEGVPFVPLDWTPLDLIIAEAMDEAYADD